MNWKKCNRFPCYEVSECGDVRRIARGIRGGRIGKIMKPYRREDGYNMFILREGNRSFHVRAHQLVAESFIGPKPFDGAQVCHNDGTQFNDHYSNLRWGTCKENHADMVMHGTRVRGERHPHAKLRASEVSSIRARYAAGGTSQRELGIIYGVRQGHIHRIITGKRWAA